LCLTKGVCQTYENNNITRYWKRITKVAEVKITINQQEEEEDDDDEEIFTPENDWRLRSGWWRLS